MTDYIYPLSGRELINDVAERMVEHFTLGEIEEVIKCHNYLSGIYGEIWAEAGPEGQRQLYYMNHQIVHAAALSVQRQRRMADER